MTRSDFLQSCLPHAPSTAYFSLHLVLISSSSLDFIGPVSEWWHGPIDFQHLFSHFICIPFAKLNTKHIKHRLLPSVLGGSN